MDLMVMARDPRSSPYLASISDLDRLLCLHELPYPNFWSRMRGAAKSNMGQQGGRLLKVVLSGFDLLMTPRRLGLNDLKGRFL